MVGPGVERILRLAPIAGGAAALTLGHTILATSDEAYYATWEHEWVHVKQYERWGPAFVPAYLLAGLWQRTRGRDAYWDNPFEVEARKKSGTDYGVETCYNTANSGRIENENEPH